MVRQVAKRKEVPKVQKGARENGFIILNRLGAE